LQIFNEKGEQLSLPDSVVSFFKGMLGQPYGGFPERLQRIVLKGEKALKNRPGEMLPAYDFESAKILYRMNLTDTLMMSPL